MAQEGFQHPLEVRLGVNVEQLVRVEAKRSLLECSH